MKKGKLVVIEGACDGIGKTTQYAMLSDRLKKDGEDIIYHHFPSYGTYHGNPVERYLSGEYGSAKELSPYFINSLYAIDRGITWNIKLKKMYEDGKFILLDRYTTSSLIYQTALFDNLKDKEKFINYVIDFEYHKIGIKEPDKTIFLYAPFDMVTNMRNARKGNEGVINDIHERDLAYMKVVYDTAMFIADYLSWDKVQCNDEDKMRSIEDIHKDVYSLVKKRKI